MRLKGLAAHTIKTTVDREGKLCVLSIYKGSYMLTKTQINEAYEEVKQLLKVFDGEVVKVNHEYQYFVFKTETVRIVFYPYDGAKDIRIRDDNSKDKTKMNLLMELLERKGNYHRKLHAYWGRAFGKNWKYSKCHDVLNVEGKCGWCNQPQDIND